MNLSLLFFRTGGCTFDRQGECTMCNYGFGERVDAERIISAVRNGLSQAQHYEHLLISPIGNMFDPHEVPAEARRRIFELAAATDCESFSCESRPEFLTPEAVAEFGTILKGKRKLINIGLESADPWIQTNCVGKSLSPEAFCTSVQLLSQNNIDTIANVLLGAPLLNEREALSNTIRTVRWALENGAHMCLVFPSNVKRWTLQHWLWERGFYQPPSLWSLVEVVHALGPTLSRNVALSWYSMPEGGVVEGSSEVVDAVPYTCQECHQDVIEQLHKYNATLDFSLIESLRRSSCACREEWSERIMRAETLPLSERITRLYKRIANELLGPTWWQENKAHVLSQLANDYYPARLVEEP